MSWKVLLLCCGVAVCLVAGLGWWWWSQVPGVDVVYGKGGDTPLTLDLDYPQRVRPLYPTILFLHPEGKWRRAAKKEERFRTVLRTFNEAGYLVASSHYRPLKETPFPGPVEDCKAAVRWLRANARGYRIDPDHIGVIGVAHGGYLACMLGTTGATEAFEGAGGSPGTSSRVGAVVSLDAFQDFTKKSWPDNFEQKFLVPFLGASFQEHPERYRQASPGTYASPDGPPFLLFHALGDEVPIAQARSLARQLKQAGATVNLVEVVSKKDVWNSALLEETLERARAFFDDQLANQKP